MLAEVRKKRLNSKMRTILFQRASANSSRIRMSFEKSTKHCTGVFEASTTQTRINEYKPCHELWKTSAGDFGSSHSGQTPRANPSTSDKGALSSGGVLSSGSICSSGSRSACVSGDRSSSRRWNVSACSYSTKTTRGRTRRVVPAKARPLLYLNSSRTSVPYDCESPVKSKSRTLQTHHPKLEQPRMFQRPVLAARLNLQSTHPRQLRQAEVASGSAHRVQMYIQCTCAPNGLGVSTVYDKFRDFGERFWPWDFVLGVWGLRLRFPICLMGQDLSDLDPQLPGQKQKGSLLAKTWF